MNNFCFDSCLLHVCIQIHFQPLKGPNKVVFRELETFYLILTTTSSICWETNNNNIAALGVGGVTQEQLPPEVSKERVLLLICPGLNIQYNFLHRQKKDRT